MNMIMRNILFLLVIFVVISCSNKDAYGYVSLMLADELSEPYQLSVVETKSVTAEQINAFYVWVDGTEISGTYGDIKSGTYKLKTGTYTAWAQNHTDKEAESQNDGYGTARYFGNKTFEILPLTLTKDVVIQCKVVNARVVAVLSDDFKAYFDETATSVRISESEDFTVRPLSMLTSDETKEAYVSAGDDVYAEVTTKKIGADTKITYRIPVITDANACTSYTVSLSVDETSTTGGIKFDVSGSDILTNDFLSIESYTPVTDFTEDTDPTF